jgi:HD-like signal output (HDOD) protein
LIRHFRAEPLPESKIDLSLKDGEIPPRPRVSIDLQVLKLLFPIRSLNQDALRAFVLDRKADLYPEGAVLFRIGDPANSVHYLLDGTVTLETAEGKTYEIQSGSVKARFPLYSGKQYTATAQAKTDIQVLRVSSKIMSHTAARAEAISEILNPPSEEIPEPVRTSPPFLAFCEHYLGAEPQLPTLPAVAAKLNQAIARACSLKELAGHIQLDPAIAARLIGAANSPLYSTEKPVNSCQEAVAILGTAATRNLVTGLCLRPVFGHRHPLINQLLHEQWKQSVYLSALCYVLAEENGGISKEEALLAGLVADIGALPFLYFLGNHPEEDWQPADIQAASPYIRGPVGAYLLEQWNFPPELAQIPLLAENWCYESDAGLGLADIVILSKLHAYLGTPQRANLPAINSIPAFSKLNEGRLSPELSLDILVKAKHKIQQAVRLFAG